MPQGSSRGRRFAGLFEAWSEVWPRARQMVAGPVTPKRKASFTGCGQDGPRGPGDLGTTTAVPVPAVTRAVCAVCTRSFITVCDVPSLCRVTPASLGGGWLSWGLRPSFLPQGDGSQQARLRASRTGGRVSVTPGRHMVPSLPTHPLTVPASQSEDTEGQNTEFYALRCRRPASCPSQEGREAEFTVKTLAG